MNFLDSSDMYGWGHNEELIGRALKGQRGRVVLATKFGQVRGPDGANLVDSRPDRVRRTCDASLRRLGVDEIDLCYQHRVDPKVPIEETVGAMDGPAAAGSGFDRATASRPCGSGGRGRRRSPP
jgi:aryl-alcohol dehydrogenase-like predicted oxidoreductase